MGNCGRKVKTSASVVSSCFKSWDLAAQGKLQVNLDQYGIASARINLSYLTKRSESSNILWESLPFSSETIARFRSASKSFPDAFMWAHSYYDCADTIWNEVWDDIRRQLWTERSLKLESRASEASFTLSEVALKISPSSPCFCKYNFALLETANAKAIPKFTAFPVHAISGYETFYSDLRFREIWGANPNTSQSSNEIGADSFEQLLDALWDRYKLECSLQTGESEIIDLITPLQPNTRFLMKGLLCYWVARGFANDSVCVRNLWKISKTQTRTHKG